MSDLVMGIDLATREARARCCDGRGTVVAGGSAPLPAPVTPRPGWVEQDATAWWPAVARALRRATDDLGPARRDVAAVAVAATSGTVVVVDAAGEPVGPALAYDDQRAATEAARAQRAGEARWDALGLRIAASFGLPKFAWLLAQREVRRRARHCYHASDAVVAHLTGEAPPSDWSHALKSGYDVVVGEWPGEVLEALEIPAGLLPDILPPTSLAGRVSGAAAAATGLPRGCEVRLGMTDGCASQIAAGAAAPGRFATVLGTTLVLKGASHSLLRDPTGAVYSHRHPGGHWLPGGASNCGGRALVEWFPGADLAALDAAAARRGPARCLCYPLVARGERFPFVHADAHGFVAGAADDEVERYRAALEGVAFVERLAYAHLTRLGAAIEPPVVSAGGGSRSAVWNRIRASLLGGTVEVAATGEAAFGACVLAASGTLHPGSAAAAAAMVPPGEIVHGAPGEEAALQENHGRFVAALRDRGWISDDLALAAAPL